MPAPPVQVGGVNAEWAQQYSNFQQGPMIVGADLYALMTTQTANEMYKSTDGGNTWTLMDAAGQPTSAVNDGGACFYDQAHTIWVAYAFSGGGPAPILIAKFDTSSDTWTTGLGTGPSVRSVGGCCLRSDNTLFIGSTGPGVASGLEADIFDTVGLTFTTTVDLGAGITGLSEYDALTCLAFNPVFCADGTAPATINNIFCGFMSTDTRIAPTEQMQNGCYFVGFNLANTTFNFFVLPNQIGNPQPSPPAYRVTDGPFMGVPAYCGAGRIVFPIGAVDASNGNYASCFVSTDSGATWTFDTAPRGIDPGTSPGVASDVAQFAPMAFWDGTKLYCVYSNVVGLVTPATAIRLCVTTPDFAANPNTWTWDTSTAQVITQIPGAAPHVNGFSFPKFTIVAGKPLFSSDIFSPATPLTLIGYFIPFALMHAGRFYGTYHGFMLAGQFSGGNK